MSSHSNGPIRFHCLFTVITKIYSTFCIVSNAGNASSCKGLLLNSVICLPQKSKAKCYNYIAIFFQLTFGLLRDVSELCPLP